jgi:replicative DNA helicase
MNDELLGRHVPHSIEAEQAVLGAMLIDARCVPEVIGKLRGDDFYSSVNKDVFETVFSMFNFAVTIDPVTVLEQMRVSGVFNENMPGYIRDLMLITPTSANVKEYAEIVKDKSLLRSIADAGADINNMAISEEGGASVILEAAEKRVYALSQSRAGDGLTPISKILIGVYEQITQASKSGNIISGTTTGLGDLDEAIMGLNNSDLIIIASRPGMGKTSIALNIARHSAKSSGKAVAVFSLEMSSEQLAMRLLSTQAGIDGKRLQTGRINGSEWNSLADSATKISSMNLLVNDNPSLSVSEMNAQCRRIPNLGLVVIDYLQLMQSATGQRGGYFNENRTQVVSEISRMMKVMAKELNVPVICLSQLSRANESRGDKRPLLSDLRESGTIEQDADIVIGLYRDSYYNSETENPNVAECIILKNRRGETGKIHLNWNPEYTEFTTIDRRHQNYE